MWIQNCWNAHSTLLIWHYHSSSWDVIFVSDDDVMNAVDHFLWILDGAFCTEKNQSAP